MKNSFYVISFILCGFVISPTIYTNAATFAGGDGSVGNPYQIENCIQLQNIKDYLTSNFVLNNDINCYDTISWNNGSGFIQIGSWPTNVYTGIFNGQNHVINDLYIGGGSTGLFGAVNGTVRNFGLNNIKVYSPSYAYLGTAVGTLLGGTVSQIFATGEVTGVSYTGGIVGWHSAGQITDVYAHVKVSGLSSGGVVGRNDSLTITNAYATGWLGVSTAERGLIGHNFGGTAVNTFYDGQLMGLGDTNGGSTPKTTAQMKSVTTFTATSTPGLTTAWDFVGNPNNDVANSDIWNINALLNSGYPYFAWQIFDTTAPTIGSITSNATDGVYTAGSVIPITINFSEPVTSTGLVTMVFETGATDRQCTFAVDHNDIATCNYVVQAGDAAGDLNVLSVSGTLSDRWGNVMTNFVPSVGLAAQKALVIDTVGVYSNGGWVGPTGGSSAVEIPAVLQTPVIATTTQKFVFTKNLSLGVVHPDVKQLQKYLNTHGYVVATVGVGSVGRESNRFDRNTRSAVMRLQKSAGIPTSGSFSLRTREYVNSH